MPRDLGGRNKTGWAVSCCCLCFWEKKKPPSCLWDLRHAGRHLCKPHQLSLAVPRLCKPGRPEWDTIGMSSYLLFIKINWPAGDVCEEFISSSCTSKCPQGEGARKLGGGGGVTPGPAQALSHEPGEDHFGRWKERREGGSQIQYPTRSIPFSLWFQHQPNAVSYIGMLAKEHLSLLEEILGWDWRGVRMFLVGERGAKSKAKNRPDQSLPDELLF